MVMVTTQRTTGSLPDVIRNSEGLYEGNLIHYFRIVFNFAQNLCNPYHNFRHMFHIVWLCYEACRFYRDRLTPQQMRNLLIAALFHDFDHSGMAGHDDLNIERAVRGMRRYLTKEDQPFAEAIEELVRTTQFPYVVDANDLDLCGEILRDADVSQALSVAWIQQCIFGLAAEWGMKPSEVLRRQEPFLKSVAFHTSWAQLRFSNVDIQAKIEETRELVSLLGMKGDLVVAT